MPLDIFFGFKVNSPFGIPAGPLINGNFVKAALNKGFDICTYKTVRSGKYPYHFGKLLPKKFQTNGIKITTVCS